MTAPFMKAPAENLLDAMHLRGDVAGREASDVADGRGVHVFQIEQDDLSIERLERVDQAEDSLHGALAIGLDLIQAVVGQRRHLIETDQCRSVSAAADDL